MGVFRVKSRDLWAVKWREDGRQRVLKEVWKSACNRAGVSMRLYDIRHISITEMLAQGADLASVAAQAGHSSIETTAKNYAHVTPKGQRHAASLIPELPPSGK